jgi:hypothetical protein
MSSALIFFLLIAATVVVLAFQRSGPRVTHIDRTVRKEKGSDDA